MNNLAPGLTKLTTGLVAGLIAGGFIASAAAIRPIGITITDEVRYLTEAQAIAEGRPLLDPASYHPSDGVPSPHYPIGWPAVLAPLTSTGSLGPFFLPVLLHLVGSAMFIIVLRDRGLSGWWAPLYFAQPAHLLFSRTLMADSIASVWTVALMLAAERRRPGWVGFLTVSSSLLKPSLTLAAVPFAAAWLIFEIPRAARIRAIAAATIGALLPAAFWIWLRLVGIGGSAGYAIFVTAMPSAKHITLVLFSFLLAWPFLPIGAIRARPSERVGAGVLLTALLFYQYDYVGPSLAATLVVGSRLELPAIVMLLPGYAVILTSFSERVRTVVLLSLLFAALTFPPLMMRALAARRQFLEDTASKTLATLRPECRWGYTPFATKLLVPYPHSVTLYSIAQEFGLRTALLAGECVDVISPLTQFTTLDGNFEDPGYFMALRDQFAHCSREVSGAARVIRLFPAHSIINCE